MNAKSCESCYTSAKSYVSVNAVNVRFSTRIYTNHIDI